MKKLLLSCYFSLLVCCIWAQQKNLTFSWSPSVMSLQQYWDSVKKKSEPQFKTPAYSFKNKQTSSIQNQSGHIFISPTHINKNGMPVLTPNSDYVYSMPGTHAFDKSKAIGTIFFVQIQPDKNHVIKD